MNGKIVVSIDRMVYDRMVYDGIIEFRKKRGQCMKEWGLIIWIIFTFKMNY